MDHPLNLTVDGQKHALTHGEAEVTTSDGLAADGELSGLHRA